MALINYSLKRHREPSINTSVDSNFFTTKKCFPVLFSFGTKGKIYIWGGKKVDSNWDIQYFDSSRAELQTTACLLPGELISSPAAGVRHESLQSVAAVTPTSVNTSGSWPLLCCSGTGRHISHCSLKKYLYNVSDGILYTPCLVSPVVE